MISQTHDQQRAAKSFVFLLIVGSMLSLILSGCAMSLGGGTTGTGLALSDIPVTDAAGDVSYFNLDGALLDETGNPVRGVQVIVGSPRDMNDARTDEDGQFNVPVVAGVGEDIVFSFKSDRVNTNYVYKDAPANITGATFTFTLTREGRIIPVDLECLTEDR